jgi:hypothetical protein
LTIRLDNFPTPAEVDLTGVEEAISDIHHQLNFLTIRLDNALTPPVVEPSESEQAIGETPIQQDVLEPSPEHLPRPSRVELTQEEKTLAKVNSQLELLEQKFNAQPETQGVKQLKQAITQITQQQNAITLRVNHLSGPPEVNLDGIKEAIAHINGQLDALNQKFNSRPETEAIEQLESAIIHVAEQLSIKPWRSEDSNSSEIDPKALEEALTDINFQINAVELCLENLPTPPVVDFHGVEQALADINLHLNALNREVEIQLGTPALQQLEEAIAQLIEHLNVVGVSFDSLPTSSEFYFDEEEVAIADLQW